MLKDAPGFSTGHNLYAEVLASAGHEAEAAQQRFLGRETGQYRDTDDPWLDELQKWCYDYEHLCVLGTVEYQTARGDRGDRFRTRDRASPGRPVRLRARRRVFISSSMIPARPRYTRAGAGPGKNRQTLGTVFYIRLSRAYRDLKQPVEAEQGPGWDWPKWARNTNCTNPLVRRSASQGRAEEANAALQKAVELNPTTPT